MRRLSIGEPEQKESLILIGRREKGHEGRNLQTRELESGQGGEMAEEEGGEERGRGQENRVRERRRGRETKTESGERERKPDQLFILQSH